MTAALKLLAVLGTSAMALSPGDSVTLDALTKARFIQGEAPVSWEPGKVYILDCWATWSPPSLATIPHLDSLHDAYHDKGLRVIGINLQEDGRERIARYVASRGEGMSYPVAFVGKGGPFEKKWFPTGGTVPQAFVVRDGKLLIAIRPHALDAASVEDFLAGGARIEERIAKIETRARNEVRIVGHLRAFTSAQKTQDAAGMAAALDAIESINPSFTHLQRMKVDAAIAARDWDRAAGGIRAISEANSALIVTALVVRQFDESAESLSPRLLETLVEILEGSDLPDPSLQASLARVEWKRGNRDQAVAAARAAATASPPEAAEAYQDFAASFERAEPQTLNQLINALLPETPAPER